MKFKIITSLLLSTVSFFLLNASAFATTYNYIGSNFIAGEVSGPYTTSMRVTGSITTSSPIPPSTTLILPSPLVTHWTFSDGVQTINSTNGTLIPSFGSAIATDPSGAISQFSILVFETPLPTVIGNRANLILASSNLGGGNALDTGVLGMACLSLDVGGVCDGFDGADIIDHGSTENLNGGSNGLIGAWNIQAESVPSLSTWGVILLMLSLLFFSQKRMGLLQVQKSRR